MSTLELNPMFLRMNKGIGNMIIYERNGKLFARTKGKKTAPPSEAQKEVNATFARLSSDWKSAGSLMNSSWQKHGVKKKSNGFNMYMKANFKREREGNAVELFKPVGEIRPPAVSAVPGGSGEIICTCTIPAGETGRHIHFYAKKKIDGISEGVFKRFSPENNADGKYTLSNFDPGSEYFIYAALTDNIYQDATQVSASACTISMAGK